MSSSGRNRSYFTHLAVLVAALCVVPTASADRARELGQVVEAYARAGQFRGAVAVSVSGKVVLDADVDDAGEVRYDAPRARLFRIASLSKHLVAACALRLVERGTVRLHEPLAPSFPELPAGALSYEGTPVTLHHLLGHTSGLAQPQSDSDYRRELFTHRVDLAALFSVLRDRTPAHKPGTEYEYNNANYDLVGALVARKSGMSYERFLREQVLGPSHRDIGITIPAVDGSRAARGVMGVGLGTLDAERWFGVPASGFGESLTSGNHFASAPALRRWLDDLFGGRMLKPESLSAMLHPGLHDYGYGVIIAQEPYGVEYMHRGAITPYGFSSWFAHLPKEHITLVALSNIDVESVPWRRFAADLTSAARGTEVKGPKTVGALQVLHATLSAPLLLAAWPGLASPALQGLTVSLMALGTRRRPKSVWRWGMSRVTTILVASMLYSVWSVLPWLAVIGATLLTFSLYVGARRLDVFSMVDTEVVRARRKVFDVVVSLACAPLFALVGGRAFFLALGVLCLMALFALYVARLRSRSSLSVASSRASR